MAGSPVDAEGCEAGFSRGYEQCSPSPVLAKSIHSREPNDKRLNQVFEFVLVDITNPGRKKKNRSIAHSHVKRVARDTKRHQQTQFKDVAKNPVVLAVENELGEDELEGPRLNHTRSVRASLIDSINSPRPTFTSKDSRPGLNSTSGWISRIPSSLDLRFSSAHGVLLGAQDRPTRQFLDHSLKVIWPAFMPGVGEGSYHPLSAAWFQAMCRSRALFHAVVVLGARHLDFLRKTTCYSDSRFVLSHKGRAIRHLRDALADPMEASSDENILAMLWLASTEVVPEDRRRRSRSAFTPPFPSDQWLDAWANVAGTEHSNMMRELIEMRGGLENIKLFGVAKVLSFATTVLVTSRLIRPYHPFLEDQPALQPSPHRFVDRKHISRTVLRNVVSTYVRSLPESSNAEPVFRSGFKGLTPLGVTEQALGVFQYQRGYSSLLEKFCSGDTGRHSRMELIDMRNAVQHRLVSLPLGCDLVDVTTQQAGVYECCRLTALLYACAVTFPMPTGTGWDYHLVAAIKQTLENLSLETWPVYRSDFHLWVLVLAGIAADQKMERSWFVDKVRHLAWRKGVRSWSEVLPILKSFLWMDIACEVGGMSLWDEVQGGELWKVDLEKSCVESVFV